MITFNNKCRRVSACKYLRYTMHTAVNEQQQCDTEYMMIYTIKEGQQSAQELCPLEKSDQAQS